MKRKVKEFERDRVVKFEEPPPRRDRRYDWEAIARQLRAHPGEWAKVFEDDLTSLVVAIRGQKIVPMQRDKGIEIRTTNNTRVPQRRCTLWARYVPDKDKEGSA